MTTERIVMNVDTLDLEDTVIIDFNVYDLEQDDVVKVGSYVHITQFEDEFIVFIYNSENKLISRTDVPFNFKDVNEL
jgi:hypothetical protein